jgi:hypothetical protein
MHGQQQQNKFEEDKKMKTIKLMKEMILEHRECRFWDEEKTEQSDNAFWGYFKTLYDALDDDGKYEIDNFII